MSRRRPARRRRSARCSRGSRRLLPDPGSRRSGPRAGGAIRAPLLHAGRRRAARGERVEVDTNAVIDRLLEHGGLADSTRRAYGFDLRAFSAWLDRGGLTLDDVDSCVLSDWVAEL